MGMASRRRCWRGPECGRSVGSIGGGGACVDYLTAVGAVPVPRPTLVMYMALAGSHPLKLVCYLEGYVAGLSATPATQLTATREAKLQTALNLLPSHSLLFETQDRISFYLLKIPLGLFYLITSL